MSKRINTDYIDDIIESIDAIYLFVENMTLAKFLKDDKTASAVIRKFEIIGEAANKLDKSIKHKKTDIPWKDVINMRNKMIHDYFGVDLATVWNTIKEDLPEFRRSIIKLKKNIN